MNKILLIIKREYLTRVRKRTFIIGTILFPLLYLGLVTATGYLAEKAGTSLNIALVDNSGFFDKGSIERENALDSSSKIIYLSSAPDSLHENFAKMGYDGYLIVPADITWETGAPQGIPIYTSRTFGLEGVSPIRTKLNNIWNGLKNEKLGIDEEKKNILKSSVINLSPRDSNETVSDSGTATVIGYVSGFLMYFLILIYGSQVMMGVMEEKTNRIAEVIVSSVKPFQLMLGKIIGIAMVALSQVLIWVACIFIIYNITSSSSGASSNMDSMLGGIQHVFTSTNMPLVIFCFIFYLLGGFFFYSSLYAAIGSSVNEGIQEVQSLSFPITMLIIISLAMMSAAMKDPTGPIAFWGSMIPFSSPIIMMARIPYGVPGSVAWWELGLSMAILIVGFLATTWFAGKIYRTGILMYGKKPTWKEMLKWAIRK